MNYPFTLSSQKLIHLFNQLGYELYPVGGCVRNHLLQIKIQDIDMCTNATPTQMLEIAKLHQLKTIPTGIKHGTLTFIIQGESIEVTTFRSESTYVNHRHPLEVQFSNSLVEDVKRRDFTMNALCFHNNTIIDYHNGIQDIEDKCIRCIDTPDTRFNEDALRILRALRFSMQLNFRIEEDTYHSIQRNAHLLTHISKERILDEFNKMLNANFPTTFKTLFDANVLTYLLGTTIHESLCIQLDSQLLNSSISITSKLALALDIGIINPTILQNLKYSNKVISDVRIIQHHLHIPLSNHDDIRRCLYYFNKNMDVLSNYIHTKACIHTINIEKITNYIELSIYNNECFRLRDLALNGNEIKQIGISDKYIGQVLTYLLEYIIVHQQENNKVSLLKLCEGAQNEIYNCE